MYIYSYTKDISIHLIYVRNYIRPFRLGPVAGAKACERRFNNYSTFFDQPWGSKPMKDRSQGSKPAKHAVYNNISYCY